MVNQERMFHEMAAKVQDSFCLDYWTQGNVCHPTRLREFLRLWRAVRDDDPPFLPAVQWHLDRKWRTVEEVSL